MAGKFLRGAFVQFMDTFLLPLPNIIIFQFNPEQIVHSWTPAQSAAQNEDDNPLATKGAPAGGGVQRAVPASQLPTVLFVWGPGRVLLVKLTSMSTTETLYDPLLLN